MIIVCASLLIVFVIDVFSFIKNFIFYEQQFLQVKRKFL